MSLKEQIERDLKTALLAGDATRVTTLRSVKSVILNEEVAKGVRDSGLNDESIIQLLAKESKKRQESADLYRQGSANDRAKQELDEKAIIDAYLPEQLSEEKLQTIVDETVKSLNVSGQQAMGQVITQVKQKVGAAADGSVIARLTKERLTR
ncbi:MAG TPA: GatB/YqeY domain-containing protein [Candidatus Saccharimonadales bacterium]|nr:GatB/YqeY domain-containing protein [Candidatus Saccharimonadales bacterium]